MIHLLGRPPHHGFICPSRRFSFPNPSTPCRVTPSQPSRRGGRRNSSTLQRFNASTLQPFNGSTVQRSQRLLIPARPLVLGLLLFLFVRLVALSLGVSVPLGAPLPNHCLLLPMRLDLGVL